MTNTIDNMGETLQSPEAYWATPEESWGLLEKKEFCPRLKLEVQPILLCTLYNYQLHSPVILKINVFIDNR